MIKDDFIKLMNNITTEAFNEIHNLKQIVQDQGKLIENQQKEIENLKNIIQMSEKSTCLITYLSKTGQREDSFHIDANKETNLPFLYILPDDNAICIIESDPNGTKIVFKKDGTYHIFFKLQIMKIMSATRIVVNTTNRHSHYLLYETQLQPSEEEITLSGENYIDIAKDDWIYVTIRSSNAIDLHGNSSIYSSVGITRCGDRHYTSFNGYTKEVKPCYDH